VLTMQLPVGSYRAALTATGRGPATVVVSTGRASTVYSLSVRARETGAFSMNGPHAGALSFGRHTVRPAPGLSLRVSGVPRKLRHGQPGRLTLRVPDPFGQPATGATVHGPGRSTAIVNARGIARLPFGRLRRGRIEITITGPGVNTYRPSIAVS